MNILRDRSFWLVIMGINVTTLLISTGFGSPEGVAYSGMGLLSSLYMVIFLSDSTDV